MSLHKDRALILSTRVFGESDKIVRFFTLRSGKLTGIAKGAKKSQKRFMNTLELFNHVNLEYFEKPHAGMVRIENADLVEANGELGTTYKKMCIASFFTEFVDRLTKEKERNEALFDVLKEGLNRVKDVEFAYPDVLYYQLNMLDHLGYMPNFRTCVQCGKEIGQEGSTAFSNERGGVVCRTCALSIPHRTYPRGLLSGLADLTLWSGEEAAAYGRYARELMEAFVHFHLNVELRSYRLLKGLVG